MGDFPPGRWHGQWIWAADTAIRVGDGADLLRPGLDPRRFDRRVLFRRTFELDAVPATAPFRVSADSRYVLYVNARELARGPVRHGLRRLHYDLGDAAPALRAGRNVVAVLARFYGYPMPWWEPTPPTFTLGGGSLVAELKLGDDAWIVTDGSWACHEPDAWTPGTPHTAVSPQIPEVLDGRRLDPRWTTTDFDDRVWGGARVLPAVSVGAYGEPRPPSEPFGALLPRPLPPPTEVLRPTRSLTIAPAGDVEPGDSEVYATVSAHLAAAGEDAGALLPLELDLDRGPVLVVADFGMVVSGHLRVEMHAPAGVRLAGALVETVAGAGTDLASAAAFGYTTRGADDTLELGDPAGGRYAVMALRGPGRARLLGVSVRERLRPRPQGPFFACSDPLLEEIHRVGLRTVDLTAHDAYIDCPTREQRAWTGDSVVHQSVDLVANPDWSLPRWHPQLASELRPDGLLPMVAAGDMAGPGYTTIPDWSLHWIRSVHNLHRYTGDRALIADLLTTAESVLRWFMGFLGDDGLLHDVTGWVLIDWSPVQVAGTSAALNALWARGLADFAAMAAWLGDGHRARWADALRVRVGEAFDMFWDDRRGGYRDHVRSGTVLPAMSEHTTAAAVCAGIVPDERNDVVRELLLDRDSMFHAAPAALVGEDPGTGSITPTGPMLTRAEPDWDVEKLVVAAQPFFRYVVHDALALLGAADRIADLCRDWAGLLEIGPTAWRETWEGGSYCHGWSSTPTRDLVVYTLGVTPGVPGYERVRVAPRLGGLAWARGAVPTPHGLVTVDVEGHDVVIESPVPVDLVDLIGAVTTYAPGHVSARLSDL